MKILRQNLILHFLFLLWRYLFNSLISSFKTRIESDLLSSGSNTEACIKYLTCPSLTLTLCYTERLSRETSALMQDVHEDFSECDEIRKRFEAWRRDYKDSYQEAYIGLCLPKLFTPIIRLSLIGWNPLEVSVKTWLLEPSSGKQGLG